MIESDKLFAGSVPENYDRYMVPLIFAPYAADLAERAASLAPAAVLETAAGTGRADETIVIVTDRAEASLRWAGNSMTTNGVSTSRSMTVISVVRKGDSAHLGAVRSSVVDPATFGALVAASQQAAHDAPEARDAAPLLTGSGTPADWGDPVPGTGAGVFAELAGSLAAGFGRAEHAAVGDRRTDRDGQAQRAGGGAASHWPAATPHTTTSASAMPQPARPADTPGRARRLATTPAHSATSTGMPSFIQNRGMPSTCGNWWLSP